MYKSSLLVLLGMVAAVTAAGCNEEVHDRAGLKDVFSRHSRQFCLQFGEPCDFWPEGCCGGTHCDRGVCLPGLQSRHTLRLSKQNCVDSGDPCFDDMECCSMLCLGTCA
ncbi:MAG: hypothetical protein J3Q66DRAFT_31284 [Benniella sp.]|nr:MAG: hypothetical protein J3Q66DRAFT_31284 [Benniella sp.]